MPHSPGSGRVCGSEKLSVHDSSTLIAASARNGVSRRCRKEGISGRSLYLRGGDTGHTPTIHPQQRYNQLDLFAVQPRVAVAGLLFEMVINLGAVPCCKVH